MSSIAKIQEELKAPKGQYNNFGKYKYRSCEDIVEALKPLLVKEKRELHLVMFDDVVAVGGWVYVKATVQIKHQDKVIEQATGWAREAETKKGMDVAQITGAASSYAHKYALNGLLAIDDEKDADSNEQQTRNNNKPEEAPEKPWYNDFDEHKEGLIERIKKGQTPDQIVKSIREKFKLSKETEKKIRELEDVPF